MHSVRYVSRNGLFSNSFFFFSAHDSDVGIGICGWLLTAFSWAIVIVTLPFSLCVCFKVSQNFFLYTILSFEILRPHVYLVYFSYFHFIRKTTLLGKAADGLCSETRPLQFRCHVLQASSQRFGFFCKSSMYEQM